MALIDSTRLRNEIQKMDFGILSVEIQRAFDRLVADQPTEEKNPVMENGDITPKEALDATARLVDRVLEILPNIMQSVIDAMPDAIEKYLKEKNEDPKTILHEIGSDGEKILDLCQFEWGHQKDKPLTIFYVNHCGGEEEMIEMQLEDTSFESTESADYKHVTDRNGHSYNIIKGFRKSITLTFRGYMPNNGYGWECDDHEID